MLNDVKICAKEKTFPQYSGKRKTFEAHVTCISFVGKF